MSLRFEWSDLWTFYNALDDKLKAHLENEIIGDGWLFQQTPKTQEQVLSGAPRDFVEKIVTRIKPDVAIKMGLNPYRR